MIDTILIVPARGDVTLLADEPGGGKVPAMTLEYMGGWVLGAVYGKEQALLLAHQGKPVPMGCDRASRALRQRLRHAYTLAYAHELAATYARRHGGRVVLLDLDGREVTRA